MVDTRFLFSKKNNKLKTKHQRKTVPTTLMAGRKLEIPFGAFKQLLSIVFSAVF